MRNLILFLIFVFTINAFAEEREAWITKSNFDGETFSYEYTAYGVGSQIKDRVKTNCDYRKIGSALVLKSVEVKVLLEADFSEPGSNVIRTGTVNVKSVITDCLRQVAGLKKGMQVPVAVVLPQISIPANQ